jgi:uncharacterized membrane protein
MLKCRRLHSLLKRGECMTGFLLALGTAVSESLKDIISKYNLAHIDEYVAAFAMHLVQSLLLFPLIMWFGFEHMSARFLWTLLISSVLQLWVILLYLKAIKRSEISVTVPLITLTPLFMLITSPVMLGQFPNMTGIAGIALIVAGTYISNTGGEKGNLMAPFLSLFRSQGSRYMLLVAFLWSITANLDKIGVEETSPLYWAFAKDFVILLYLIPIMLYKSGRPLHQVRNRIWPLISVGFFRFTSVVTQMFAIELILVPYVISIKRSSTAFVILFAFFYFNERASFRNRLAGIIIILAGLFVIAVS